MNAEFKVTKDGIRKQLEAMVARGKSPSAFMQRVTLNQYKKAQVARWETEGASEDVTWEPLTSISYKAYKRRRYASYDGAGNKLMIATGGLYQAATGRGQGMYKLITDTSFVVGIDLNAANPEGKSLGYAAYAAEKRPIMEFSDATLDKWRSDIANYIFKGRDP